METETNLYAPENVEQLNAVLSGLTEKFAMTQSVELFEDIFQVVSGYADHLKHKMVAFEFGEPEAEVLGWQTAWDKLYDVMGKQKKYHVSYAANMFERQLSSVNPNTDFEDSGRPKDPATRTFYRTFVKCIDHHGINQGAAWLYAHD